MRKLIMLTFLLCLLTTNLRGQNQGGIIKTGIVIQNWTIEDLPDPVSEGTFPIEIHYPLRDNLNLQLNHSPAVSRYGDFNLSGLSDTWIRSTYAFSDRRALLSFGVGLPTGKTKLTASETSLTYLLSQNAFKFRLPVFGQGLTISGGAMYAYPINTNMTIGAGLNYVFRGKYKFNKLQPDSYDPGDQWGINLGFDYIILPDLRSNIDVIINYYTADKLKNTKVFASGTRFSGKVGLQYQMEFGLLWLKLYYSSKTKNETWDGQSLAPQAKNSNIALRELESGVKLNLTDILALTIGGEVRSYVENEMDRGWVDIVGFGPGYELALSEKFVLAMSFKLFFGDGEFMSKEPGFSGMEFDVGTQWKF